MKLFINKFVLALAVLGSATNAQYGNAQSTATDTSDYEWTSVDVTLPKPISDHTATLSRNNGLVYIAGGCDSPLGNEFAGDFFFCASLSDKLYVFDPTASTVSDLGQMPRTRYRHSANIVGNELWLIGGRDEEDNIITEIDIYNIESAEWRTLTLQDDFLTSDQASFTGDSSSKFIYVAGGYNATYAALATVFRIDTTTSAEGGLASIGVMAPLQEARGDIEAASDGNTAFLGGGFTDANGFCAPLPTVESYNIAGNTWKYESDLINDRGEVNMVELNGQVFAMGGERQIDNICEITGDTDPGELTVGLEVVEVLESGTWEVVDNFPTHRFRLAAVGYDETNKIYVFGGQVNYDDSCECFKTTDDIQTFVAPNPSSAFSLSNHATAMTTAAVAALMTMLL
mmetsp:Transcript_14248/g.34351  ORF Transcript_14248/g.34351 Transcript_14248/m.34351 type:complete len:400 (-) Transcript_14248:227-1426(-)